MNVRSMLVLESIINLSWARRESIDGSVGRPNQKKSALAFFLPKNAYVRLLTTGLDRILFAKIDPISLD